MDIGLNVFICKVRMKKLKLFPMVSEYLNKPVFIINRLIVKPFFYSLEVFFEAGWPVIDGEFRERLLIF